MTDNIIELREERDGAYRAAALNAEISEAAQKDAANAYRQLQQLQERITALANDLERQHHQSPSRAHGSGPMLAKAEAARLVRSLLGGNHHD